jgi:uncharacterized protein
VKRSVVAFASGLLFAIGLVVSGMTQPAKVVGFLDFFGDWDPSLAFVMGGAVMVNVGLYWLTMKKRQAPVFDLNFHVTTNQQLTPRLFAGSALFGIGWGLGGFCPGPALTSIATATIPVLTFVVAMFAGIYLFRVVDQAFKGSAS